MFFEVFYFFILEELFAPTTWWHIRKMTEWNMGAKERERVRDNWVDSYMLPILLLILFPFISFYGFLFFLNFAPLFYPPLYASSFPSIFPSFHSSTHLIFLALFSHLFFSPFLQFLPPTSIASIWFYSSIYIIIFILLSSPAVSFVSLSLPQPLPPSIPPSDLSFSSVSTHNLTPSLAVRSAVFLLTLHGLVWCRGTGSCWPTRFTAQSSLQIESSHRNLVFFFYLPLFLLSSTCTGSPPRRHPVRERQGKSRDPLLFTTLLSFHSSSSFSPLLSATLNSPSLIQLPGRRDSACSDRFTPHGPTSRLDHLHYGRCGNVCV